MNHLVVDARLSGSGHDMLASHTVAALCAPPTRNKRTESCTHTGEIVVGSLNYSQFRSMNSQGQQSLCLYLPEDALEGIDSLGTGNKHKPTTCRPFAAAHWWVSQKNSILRDCKRNSAEQAIWMEGWLKPPLELVFMTQRQIQTGACSSSVVEHGSSGQQHNRLTRLNEMQSRVRHQCRSIDSSAIIDPSLQAGPKGRGNKGSYSIQRDVRTLCKEGRLKEALHLMDLMDQQGIQACSGTYASLLQACIKLRALSEGKQVHAHMIKSGFKLNVFMGSTLVNLYAKCGSVVDARRVFDEMPYRNVFTWTIMIAGYVKHSHAEEALELFKRMEGDCVKPNVVTFVCILKACCSLRSLEQGKQIHAQIIRSGFESDAFVSSTLIDMYAKCGSLEHACQMFNKTPRQNVVSWTAMIAGYTQHGQSEEAFKLFCQMEQEGVKPNEFTFVVVLNACSSLGDLEKGKQIHAYINSNGFESDVYIVSALIDMYAHCGDIEHARQVFEEIHKRDVVVWTAMIAGYAQHGHNDDAIKLFLQMQQEGVKPNKVTFASVLKAYASLGNLEQGIQVYSQIIKSGFESDGILGGAIIDMYAKCGGIELACQVFDKMPKQNVVPWNAMILGYAHCGHGDKALKLFWQMERQGINPDEFTFVGIFKACASLRDLEQGKQIHAQIIESGVKLDNFVWCSLIDMYVKCGSLEHAREVFDKTCGRDVVLWTVMISGYVQHGHGNEAFQLFWRMLHEDIQPNEVTFVGILKACALLGDLEQGKQVHALITESGFKYDVFIGSTLVDMYAKCRSINNARQVFDSMPERNEVSWTTVIAGYAQNGQCEEALKFFQQMQQEGMKPNEFTVVAVLSACASLGDLEQGKQIHAFIRKNGLDSDIFVVSTLVDMYAKCGSIVEARQVFDKVLERDVVLWTAMIAGYAKLERRKEVFELFWQMEVEGVKPNEVTFAIVLKVCASLAALDEGQRIHAYIVKCGFESDVSVGCSIVDMYAKCRSLELARQVFDKLPKQDVALWNVMIAGYAQYGHGNQALQIIEQMHQEGVKPNHNTFVGVLSACSRAGLVDEGYYYFNSMSRDHSLTPTGKHYACMADLLVRAGRLKEATDFIRQHAMLT